MTSRIMWVLQILLTLLFLFAGGVKLVTPIDEMTRQFGMPGPFLRFIGVVEVLGALGLILPGALRLLPGLTPLAAAGLGMVMIGAVVVTIQMGMLATALFPFVVGVLLAVVAYNRWKVSPHQSSAAG